MCRMDLEDVCDSHCSGSPRQLDDTLRAGVYDGRYRERKTSGQIDFHSVIVPWKHVDRFVHHIKGKYSTFLCELLAGNRKQQRKLMMRRSVVVVDVIGEHDQERIIR